MDMEVLSDSVNSSALCFASSSSSPPPPPPSTIESLPPDIEALRRLSSNLSSLFLSNLPSFSDVTVTLQSHHLSLPLHRCILSARSPFFHRILLNNNSSDGGSNGSPSKLDLGEHLAGFDVGYEALALVLGYVYSGKVGPLPTEVSECADEECRHVACWPAVDFMLQLLFVSFKFEIWELLSLFQRRLLGIFEKVDIDDLPMVLYVADLCGNSCAKLLSECIEMVVTSDLDIVTLGKTLPQDIVKQILDSRTSLRLGGLESVGFPEKHVTRIHKALDSDDIELVKLLLDEGRATLDDAYALHYAVAHCSTKTTAELLGLKCGDVNRKNLRGYTVLHVAAMRKEPEILVCLLDNGARPYDHTPDGRKAIRIAKRLTKLVDYGRPFEQCKNSSKDRLCIDILEKAETGDPLTRETCNIDAMAAGELLQQLQYLEIRVHLAKLLYPAEAKVAMFNAHVDGTLEFTLGRESDLYVGQKGAKVIFNNMPFKLKEEHLSRMRALSKTVEIGMHYFPRCSEVLSKIVDDDYSVLSQVGDNTTEGRRKRYLELQEEMMRAFRHDKEQLDGGSVSCSTSSKPAGRVRTKSARKS